MSQIRIRIKGKQEITISSKYNSLAPYQLYRDDVKFGEGTNSLKDYLFTTNCVVWQDDQIKILSLPDKGKLFYLTNPNNPTPIYAQCFLGQMIVVRDILDNKVLKFQAEGFTDNAFTGTYMTMFKFERFCGQNASNVVTHLNLSLVDEMTIPYKVYFTDVVQDEAEGETSFNLHVEGAPFVGYANAVMTNGSVNGRQKLTNFTIPSLSLNMVLKIVSGNALGMEDRRSTPITIPVGVYSGSIVSTWQNLPQSEMIIVSSGLNFGLTTVFEEGDVSSTVYNYLSRVAVTD